MTNIRAVDLPQVRAEIQQSITADLAERFRDPGRPRRQSDGSWADVAEALADLVGEAELYFVATPMSELTRIAADSLEMVNLSKEDVPCDVGLIFFDHPMGTACYECDHADHAGVEHELNVPIYGAIWAVGDDYLWIMPITTAPPGLPGRLVVDPALRHSADFGESIGISKPDDAATAPSMMLAQLLTAWLLMNQPLAEREEVKPDRAATRRLRRIGKEPAAVRVITLRRPRTDASGNTTDREYHHQWIVRGHWRQQWYPSREVHRPVWIAPHVKGPEGAPLLGGEKVHAWIR